MHSLSVHPTKQGQRELVQDDTNGVHILAKNENNISFWKLHRTTPKPLAIGFDKEP